MSEQLYKCPVCQNPLIPRQRMYACKKNHSFDLSGEGYLNLLLANQKHSKSPGDSRAMMSARRRFLNAGYYSPLSLAINQIIRDEMPAAKVRPSNILDAGCGEGYYMDELQKSLNSSGLVNYWGIDISKEAVRSAGKRNLQINWAVAGVFDLPFISSGFDCLFSVFAPVSEPEFERVLKRGGIAIIVTPGARHLWGLKELLYEVPYTNPEDKFHPELLKPIAKHRLNFDFLLDRSEKISDLIAMTPYYWNTDMAKINSIKSDVTSLTTCAEFIISIYRK